MSIELRQAEARDIEQLVEARVTFFRVVRGEDWVAEQLPDLEGYKTLVRGFFEEYLESSSFFGVVAEDAGQIVGTVFASLCRSLPHPFNHEGLTAKIVSVYTADTHQNQGVATGMMELMIDLLQSHGVGRVELEYTDVAFRAYERLGFEEVTRYMGLNI